MMSSVSFRITRTAEDLAETIAVLSQKLVKLEQRQELLERQLEQQKTAQSVADEELAALESIEQQLRDTRIGAGQAAVSREVRREVLDAFVRRLETWMVGRPELDSCSAWYKNEQFRVVQNWPGTMSSYWWYTRTFRPAEFRFVTH